MPSNSSILTLKRAKGSVKALLTTYFLAFSGRASQQLHLEMSSAHPCSVSLEHLAHSELIAMRRTRKPPPVRTKLLQF